MKRYKISLLHYSCPPIVGGVEAIISQHAHLLNRHNHLVKIFAGDGGIFTDEVDIELNPLLSSRNPKILRIHDYLSGESPDLESCSNEIFDYLARALDPFDVLIAHNVLTMHYNLPLTLALHRLANKGTIKVVGWNHDSPYFYSPPPIDSGTTHWRILKRHNPNIHYVTISEERREEFQGLYGLNTIDVIPNGIDPVRFLGLDPGTISLIHTERLFETDLLMLQPCRLHPRKNIELSVRVLKALQEKGVYARLLLTGAHNPHETGTVDYYHKIEKLAEELGVARDLLIVTDYLPDSEKELAGETFCVKNLCLIADLLFIPSLQEGFGIPLLEAGLLKLPIVCSGIPPLLEIGQENVHYFSLHDSPEQIADKILAFMTNLKPHKMFRHVLRNYVWDDIYQGLLLPLLERVIGR